jgi:integrase
MAKALTSRTVELLKPSTERREIPDGLLQGLYLVLQPSGARSWAVRYRHGGRPRKHTLGSYPAIDLAAARKLASAALRAVAEGRDPGVEKRLARSPNPDTIEAVAEAFLERHVRRTNRPSTISATERLLRSYVLPRWRGRLASEITRRDVLDVLDRVHDAGKPIAANRVLAAVRKLFNWAASRDIITASPCAGVKPLSPEQSRDRVLSDPELCDVWRAADQLGGPFGALVKLLILTGQRRDEVAGMRWEEVNLNTHLWLLPAARTKNKRAHEVPLSSTAVAVVRSLPRLGDTYILTSIGDAPVSGYSKAKTKLDTLMPKGIPPWRLHDLRRTVASGMAKLGVNLPVIEKVLNHVSGSFSGVAGVYQRHSFEDEKRAALEVWSGHLRRICAQ